MSGKITDINGEAVEGATVLAENYVHNVILQEESISIDEIVVMADAVKSTINSNISPTIFTQMQRVLNKHSLLHQS